MARRTAPTVRAVGTGHRRRIVRTRPVSRASRSRCARRAVCLALASLTALAQVACATAAVGTRGNAPPNQIASGRATSARDAAVRSGGSGGRGEPTGEVDDLALEEPAASPLQARYRRRLEMTPVVAERCARWRPVIEVAARAEGIDPTLMSAVAWVESRFEPDARSGVGARGLMQLMPGTAEAQGCDDPEEPTCAAQAAARLLVYLLARFEGHEVYALCAYNAGAGRVNRAWRARVLPANFGYAEVVLHARSRLARDGCAAAGGR